MKSLILLALLVMAGSCSAVINTDRLEDAIEQSTLARVKSQYKKIEQEEMTPQERKKILSNLYDLAEDVSQKRLNSLSIIGDWRDAAKTGIGIWLSVSGALGLLKGLLNTDPGYTAGSALYSSLGGFLLYKGISCSSQRVVVDEAKAIENFLRSKLRNVEDAG